MPGSAQNHVSVGTKSSEGEIVRSLPRVKSRHLGTYTLTQYTRRPGRVWVEHVQAPEGATATVLGEVARRRDLVSVTGRWVKVEGPVGTLAVRMLTREEWSARVAPRVRSLCLAYLRDVPVVERHLRANRETGEGVLRVTTLRARLDPLLRLAHGAWPQGGWVSNAGRFIPSREFALTRRPWDVAAALSTVWGVHARTLRVCDDCAQPFVGPWCACRPERVTLSKSQHEDYRRVVSRFRSRQRPGRAGGPTSLKKTQVDGLLRQAAEDTRTLSWTAWRRKWDEGTMQPKGRPSTTKATGGIRMTESERQHVDDMLDGIAKVAKSLGGQARKHIMVRPVHGLNEPFFFLRVGSDGRYIRARWRDDDTWRVDVHGDGQPFAHIYADDAEFENNWPTLLKPLVAEAVKALDSGKEQPANDW